jgi:hypothetical protein
MDIQCGVFGDTIVFCPPITPTSFEELLLSVLIYLQNIIAGLAVIFIIIGALQYIFSAGNEEKVVRVKKTITSSLIGFSISIAAPSFLHEIAQILGWTGAVGGNPITLSGLILIVLNFLLSLVGGLALIFMIIGAIFYLTSAGDEERIDKAKKMIKYSIIGITVALSALVIVKQIAVFFAA